MKNAAQLRADVDSMSIEYIDDHDEVKEQSFRFFDYHLQDIVSVYKRRAIERQEARKLEEEEKEMGELGEFELIEKQKNDSILDAIRKDSAKSFINIGNSSKGRKSSLISKSEINEDSLLKRKPKNIQRLKTLKSVPKVIPPGETEGSQAEVTRKKEEKVKVKSKMEVAEEDTVKELTFEEKMVIIDSLINEKKTIKKAFTRSLTHVRHVKNNVTMRSGQLIRLKSEINKYELERHKKLSYAITILIMFFIGAPLGAIIKRGGLGVPVLISLSFFILFYVISMMCEKWTRSNVMDPLLAAWMANILLFPIGMFFMKQAKNDARLFETDFYNVVFMKVKSYIFVLKSKFKQNK